MGRRRTTDLHLPPRMYRKGGAYYHVKGKWTPLGSDLAKARVAWARIENAGSGGGTVSELVDRYLLSKFFLERAENTRIRYARSAEVLRRVFGGMMIAAVRPKDVADYLDQHKLPLTANNEVGVLSTMYEKALRWGLADINPCKGIRRNPIPKRDRYLEDDEYGAIWQRSRPLIQVAMDLAYATGLRIGDLCRMKFADAKEGVLSIRQQKTGKPIAFQVEGDLAEVLERARTLRPPLRPTVLCTRQGRPCDPENVSREFIATAGRLRLVDVHFHDIRSKTASDDPDGAKERLGHQDERTTQGYIRKRQVVKPLRKVNF